jgi:hypothetical protein
MKFSIPEQNGGYANDGKKEGGTAGIWQSGQGGTLPIFT